jgi:hypothetical protein
MSRLSSTRCPTLGESIDEQMGGTELVVFFEFPDKVEEKDK